MYNVIKNYLSSIYRIFLAIFKILVIFAIFNRTKLLLLCINNPIYIDRIFTRYAKMIMNASLCVFLLLINSVQIFAATNPEKKINQTNNLQKLYNNSNDNRYAITQISTNTSVHAFDNNSNLVNTHNEDLTTANTLAKHTKKIKKSKKSKKSKRSKAKLSRAQLRQQYVKKLENYLVNNSVINQKFMPIEVMDGNVWKFFHSLIPTNEIRKIYTTPYKDVYAVVAGRDVFYGSTKSAFIFAGQIFNPYTQQNITFDIEYLISQSHLADFSKIKTADAIISRAARESNPNGRKILIFEDPNCLHSRELERFIHINNLENRVDIYRVLVDGNTNLSRKMINDIHCAKNFSHLSVLKQYMLYGSNAINNQAPNLYIDLIVGCNLEKLLERTNQMIQDLDIRVTPTIVLGDKRIIRGIDTNILMDYIDENGNYTANNLNALSNNNTQQNYNNEQNIYTPINPNGLKNQISNNLYNNSRDINQSQDNNLSPNIDEIPNIDE